MGNRQNGKRYGAHAERWKKHFERQRILHKQIRDAAEDILQSRNFRHTREHIQHGNMTVKDHCINVAKCSIILNRKLHFHCNQKELIRGALLHDYFLYDWHDKDYVMPHNLHGFRHPARALRNASREYELTDREKDIIKKHMWPLTVVPPACREAWVVTMADKWCSLLETVHLQRGHGKLIRKLRDNIQEPDQPDAV